MDQVLLAQIAAAGGGRVLADATEAMASAPRAAEARWPAWQLLLVLAALLWPLEIASRRLSVSEAGTWLDAARSRTFAVQGRTRPRTQRLAPSTPPPAVRRADRLLDRKRAFRDRRDKKR